MGTPMKYTHGDTDTIATADTSDGSYIGNASNSNSSNNGESPSWDLSWYECFLAFESKQRERKTTCNEEIDDACFKIMERVEEEEAINGSTNKKILVPPSVIAQMELVKQQMTEYNTMLEVYEETVEK